jgi:hypothetical protein
VPRWQVVTQDDDNTAAMASVEEAAEYAARADAQVRGVLGTWQHDRGAGSGRDRRAVRWAVRRPGRYSSMTVSMSGAEGTR